MPNASPGAFIAAPFTGGLSLLQGSSLDPTQGVNMGGKGQPNPYSGINSIANLQKKFGNQILQGNAPPAFRDQMENQFNVAQNQAKDLLPRGGQLDQALLNLDTQRAQSVAGIPASLLPLAFGGLGQAQQAYGGLAQAGSQKKQGTGQALGKLGATAILAG